MPFTVQDLIKDRRKPVVVGLTDTAQRAVDLMMEHDYGQLPVIDHESRPRGLVTSDSILRAHSSLNLPLAKLHVRDAMAEISRVFKAGDNLFELLEDVMDSGAVLIVDGEGRVTSIATGYDTTEYFRRRFEDQMLLEDIEMSLRQHIQVAYSGPNGPDAEALDAAVKERARDQGGLRGKFREALKKYGAEKAQGPLDHSAANIAFDAVFASDIAAAKFGDLNLSDYVQMVVHGDKWRDHFQSIFAIEAAALKFMLEAVTSTRNSHAHFRGEITSAEWNHVRFCAAWLARHPATPAAQSRPTAGQRAAGPTGPAEPVPPPPPSEDLDRAQAEDFSPEDSRYTPLAAHLLAQTADQVELTFAQVEEIIGGQLPAYARKHPSFWANDSVGHVQSRQWLEVGWRMLRLNLGEEKVTFYRPTERAQAYLAFYTELVDDLENASPGLFAGAGSIGLNWLNVRSVSHGGQKVGSLAFAFAQRGRFRAELYIDSGDGDRNKANFDGLKRRQADIESRLGEVAWERLDHRRASRIALYHAGRIDDSPEDLAALRAWATQSMIQLNWVIVPLLVEARS
jgi:CBS domain-containing protein